jgi:hypothetical protein
MESTVMTAEGTSSMKKAPQNYIVSVNSEGPTLTRKINSIGPKKVLKHLALVTIEKCGWL